jgi:GT2 family glycosyltransferase
VADGPVVSVLIPTHQRREALRRALLALAEQTDPADSYEAIVSVDGSSDGTEEMLAALDIPYDLQVTAGPARGRASACNSGLALARGEILIVLDDDMQPAPPFVESHRAHHPPGSRRCALGAVPIEPDDSSPRAARYVAAKFNSHLERLAEPGHEFAPRDFYSGNASLRTETMRQVGGFDESFTVYGNEDVDLWLRLRAAGIELLYEPAALARQEYDKGLRVLCGDTIQKGRTTVILAGMHPEVFASLRLARPWDNSRAWIVARALLLDLSRRAGATASAVFALAVALERLGAWRQPLFYRAVLDFAFWAGVEGELRESNPKGELRTLAEELRRGPIDLLLHR